MRKYKWGILGPGSIARSFAKGLAVLDEAAGAPGVSAFWGDGAEPFAAERYAVGSRDLGRAQAFADGYGFKKAYGSYAGLAADPDVEIIYVATPNPQHEEAVVTCLNAKKAVICEKPFAANARQAARMIGCARENGVFLMEAVWTRFLPSICKTRELIAEGAIGDVLHVYADFGFRADVNPEGRLFNPAAAGGSLLDVGVYNISFANMITGKQPDRVQSHLTIGSTGVDESSSIIMNYRGGQSASLFSAIRVQTPQDAAIYGDKGYIKLPSYWHGDTVMLYNKDGAKEFKLPFEPSGFQYEAAEVMACVGRGLTESPVMPLDDTLANVKTMDKIRFDNNLRYPFE